MRELVAGVAGTLGGVLFLVSVVGVIAAPLIILLFAPKWAVTGTGEYDLAVQMLRWTFPYLFFISHDLAVLGRAEQLWALLHPGVHAGDDERRADRRRACSSPSTAAIRAWRWPSACSSPACCRCCSSCRRWRDCGLLTWPRWRPALEGVRRVAKLMVPGIVGSSMAQISLLIDTQIATFLVTGSVTWLYYADRLMEFPLGVFSIALATVILPGLSAQHARRRQRPVFRHAGLGAATGGAAGAPAAVGMLCFAGPMTAMILGYGAIRPAGRAEDQLCADGLFLGPAGLQLGEGAGAGLFRAPGHASAGAHRADRAGRDHGAEYPAWCCPHRGWVSPIRTS